MGKAIYENQRLVTVHKKTYEGGKQTYGVIGEEEMKTAFQKLSKTSFALWLYFVKNQPNHNFGLSRVDVMNFCNISKNSYHRAFKELVDTGYLIKTGGNTYDFFENPKPPITKARKSNYMDRAIDDLVATISK